MESPAHTPAHRARDSFRHTARQFTRRHAVLALRLSIGLVYLWFGVVKFFPGLSPAEHIVNETFRIASFGAIPPDVARALVAAWEFIVGVGLLTGLCMRTTLVLLGLQLAGAMAPLVLMPETTWKMPFVLTMDGQYIVKDLIVISAAIVLASTLHPQRARGAALPL